MTDTPLTNQQLDEIAARAAGLYEYATGLDDAWQAEADQLAGTDVPALVAEIRRQRAVIDAEKTAHLFTLRQRNNRSQRLAVLHDLAVAGDLEALAAAAKDALTASVDDHRDCHERATALEATGAPVAGVQPAGDTGTPDSAPQRLLRATEHYLSALHSSVARHDNLAANYGCAGCELLGKVRNALTAPAVVETGE